MWMSFLVESSATPNAIALERTTDSARHGSTPASPPSFSGGGHLAFAEQGNRLDSQQFATDFGPRQPCYGHLILLLSDAEGIFANPRYLSGYEPIQKRLLPQLYRA